MTNGNSKPTIPGKLNKPQFLSNFRNFQLFLTCMINQLFLSAQYIKFLFEGHNNNFYCDNALQGILLITR